MNYFFCPHCQQTLSADDALAGGQVACPKCGQTMTIPAARPPPAMPAARLANLPEWDEPDEPPAPVKRRRAAVGGLDLADWAMIGLAVVVVVALVGLYWLL